MSSDLSRRQLLGSAAALGVAAALRLRAGQTPTYSSGVKVVNVLATVHDKQGRIVRNRPRPARRHTSSFHRFSI